MTQPWTDLESASLPGGHRLQAWLGGDERGAFFQTVPGSPGNVETCALVKLIPECLVDAEAQLARGVHLRAIARHVLGLYHGAPGARAWRRVLSDSALLKDAGPELFLSALREVEPLALAEV